MRCLRLLPPGLFGLFAVFAFALAPAAARAAVPTRSAVRGEDVASVTISSVTARSASTPVVPFTGLSTLALDPQTVRVGATFAGDKTGIEVPHCAGRGAVVVDGTSYAPPPGPFVLRLPARKDPHTVTFDVVVSAYEKRVACSEPIHVGALSDVHDGLVRIDFTSPPAAVARGGGFAVLYVPPGHDARKPGPLLVGVHPWNGTPWTYAAYAELLAAAQKEDVPLLMPSGLGNSLYVADAEAEVWRAIDAAKATLAVDEHRVSIWGASMGGQGAMTIALHRPDKFAVVGSFFGDARFDVTGYVRTILPTPEAAHRVNPIDVIDNARHQYTFLIHGDADKTSAVIESDRLNEALVQRSYGVSYDRVPGRGHEGLLVVQHVAKIVARAKTTTAPAFPTHVTFRSVRAEDVHAYGVRIVRAAPGDAFVDLERTTDGNVNVKTENVKEIVLEDGALGLARGAGLSPHGTTVPVHWE
jgi:pimeloyl-ACP methyl ester carboxylesterase